MSIKPLKIVRKFFVVVDSSTGECLTDDDTIDGAFSYVHMCVEGLQYSKLGLSDKLLFTELDKCRVFEEFSEAERVAKEWQEKDPEGDFDVLTIVENQATLYTLE